MLEQLTNRNVFVNPLNPRCVLIKVNKNIRKIGILGFVAKRTVICTYKKTMKWKEQEFYARAMAELPRILFGCQRGNVRYARLGLITWLKYSPRKALRGKLPVRYQGLTLRFAVSVDFSFLNKLFGLKIDDK